MTAQCDSRKERNNKFYPSIDREEVYYHSRGGAIRFSMYFVRDFGSESIHFLSPSFSFRCLKRRNDAYAHLYSRCKVWVTRNANINCHYEVRRKEARSRRGKDINLLVCQNAFSFLGLKLISLAYESRVDSCMTRGSYPKKRAIISQRAGCARQRENEIIGNGRRVVRGENTRNGNGIHGRKDPEGCRPTSRNSSSLTTPKDYIY